MTLVKHRPKRQRRMLSAGIAACQWHAVILERSVNHLSSTSRKFILVFADYSAMRLKIKNPAQGRRPERSRAQRGMNVSSPKYVKSPS